MKGFEYSQKFTDSKQTYIQNTFICDNIHLTSNGNNIYTRATQW